MLTNFFVGDGVVNLVPHFASDKVLIPLHASGVIVHTEGISAVVEWDLGFGNTATTSTSFTRITRDTRVRHR